MITRNSNVICEEEFSEAVKIAVKALNRDIKATCIESDLEGIDIVITKVLGIEKECFVVKKDSDKKKALVISASDDIGVIYGIYHISKNFLGVNEFWFWNEQIFEKKEYYAVPSDYLYKSKPFKVRFRGWFINDEVLFDGWKPDGNEAFPWEMAFESLLRCGGNMTIPGTDFNSHKYKSLANRYGLWITHHHAEPLGARMFARAYPDLEASFDKYPELFRGLWKEAIEDQKDCNVVWNIGFRGQGDRPFWADDPAYDTPKARGRLMSDLMLEQYKLVKKSDPDAVCCTNLYGETMELYRDGYLSFPEDVIKIWADNGFGRMVSRRQGNHNPRVYALPKDGDNGLHGIYYHASFYDLQAAAQMTMLPNSPEFVVKELQNVYSHSVDDFWIINCSNVKPHTYILDLIADMWRTGEAESAGDIEKSQAEYAEQHLREYCLEYYGRGLDEKVLSEIENLYELWPKYCIQYDPNEDDHAGEQFSNHGARILTCAFISNFCKDKPLETRGTHDLDWVCRADTLAEQVAWFEEKYKKALEGYTKYLSKCNEIKKMLEVSGKTETAKILDDNLICQVEYHYYSYKGAYHALRAMEICLGDNEKTKFATQSAEIANGNKIDYISAFYEAGLSSKAFFDGYETMRSHEHGIWKNFYRNDCEADIRQSGYVLKSLMSYLRVLGDGPHFYKWQRIFQKESGGDKVHLILRVKEHLTDEEIWKLMDELFS